MTLHEQPKAVWAVAFACVVAFMGIGLVDPILPAIAEDLDATPSQVVAAVHQLLRGHRRRDARHRLRLQPHRRRSATLLPGLALVVLFSALAGRVRHVGEIVGFRAGWGLGNALFIATALAMIVGAAARRRRAARSSSTRPRSASASPPARCSAACSAASPGAARSSAPRR